MKGRREFMIDVNVNFKPDDFGPEKVIVVYGPRTKMQGDLVIDNTARGPASVA